VTLADLQGIVGQLYRPMEVSQTRPISVGSADAGPAKAVSIARQFTLGDLGADILVLVVQEAIQ